MRSIRIKFVLVCQYFILRDDPSCPTLLEALATQLLGWGGAGGGERDEGC